MTDHRIKEASVLYWVAVAGTRERPVDNLWWTPEARWEGNLGTAHMFSRAPRIRVGHRLVMYASGSPKRFGAGKFFAVREVVSNPQPSENERWPWRLSLLELVSGPELARCPNIERIGVRMTSLRSHSHIRIVTRAGEIAKELLEQASS
jgi:hypothetical protein